MTGCGSHAWSARGFTLVELLVVVVVVALLAAIAVVNLLEAQTRSKVARTRADLRTIATGLEAYAAEANDYPPNDGDYNVVPIELTTPVAFLSDARLVDPFSDKEVHPVHGQLARFYTYTKIVDIRDLTRLIQTGRAPAVEGVDGPLFNPGAFRKYGKWRLVGNGPDRRYSYIDAGSTDPDWNDRPLYGADTPYDPTNGTVSRGNLLRTQNASETF